MIKPLPELNVTDFEESIEFIIEFYRTLGWCNGTEELDPRKIKIHPDTWGEICTDIKTKWGLGAALSWMNSGPSADESNRYNLKKDQVKIEEGAMATLQSL